MSRVEGESKPGEGGVNGGVSGAQIYGRDMLALLRGVVLGVKKIGRLFAFDSLMAEALQGNRLAQVGQPSQRRR